MKIENQVCSLKQAKHLKAFGIIQRSYFNYYRINTFEQYSLGSGESGFWYSAFTVAELGVMLPASAYTVYQPLNNKSYSFLDAEDLTSCDNVRLFSIHATEAEARAAMLIYLLENNIITADEVNKKLIE